MATISWGNASGGLWSTYSDWSTGTVPTSADTVLINQAGTYEVIAEGFGTIAAYSVTLASAGADLYLDYEALSLGGTMLLQSGTLSLGGTIVGGTIDVAGGTVQPSYDAALAGVKLEGSVVLGGLNLVSILNGLQLLGIGAGPGIVDLRGSGLWLPNGGIIAGGTILVDATTTPAPSIAAATGTITLASNMVVVGEGASAGYLTGNVLNEGLVTVTAGNALVIGGDGYSGTFVNAGTLAVASGAVLVVAEPFQNTGTIKDAGATIMLDGIVSPAELVSFATAGAAVELAGVVNGSGGTITLGGTLGGSVQDLILAGGTILNAVVQLLPGATLSAVNTGSPAVLSGVTLQGTETLSVPSTDVAFSNGLTLAGTLGAGAGTLVIASGAAEFLGANIVSGGTIVLANGLNSGSLVASGGPVTLASGMVLQTLGGALPFASAPALIGTFINYGQIEVAAGSSLSVGAGGTFWNTGGLTVAAGGTLLIAGSVANSGTTSIKGVVAAFGSLSDAQLLADHNVFSAPLTLEGTLGNAGSILAVGAGTALGTLTLGPGAYIAGGTISDAGGGLVTSGGTLAGVAYRGTLQAGSGVLGIVDGLTLTQQGSGAGTFNILPGATVALLDTEAIDNATIDLGGTVTGTLSLGPHAVLSHAALGFQTPTTTQFSGLLVNSGLISAGLAGGAMSISSLSNGGSISVTGGDFLTIGTLFNTGSISVSAGGALALESIGSNAGSITETNATLNLDGSISLPFLTAIGRAGGIINLEGTLSLGGGTLSVGAGTALNQLRNDDDDVIVGGTIHDTGSGLVFIGPAGLGGTLNADVYQGTLNLVPAGSTLTVSGGTSFTGLSGTGTGTIDLLGAASYLAFQGSQTLNNLLLNIGNSYQATTLAVTDQTGAGGAVVTFGTSASLVTWGTQSEILIGRGLGDTLLNDGQIGVTGTNGKLLVAGGTFTNAGNILIANGSTLGLESDAIGNIAGGTLSGGSWQILANSALDLGLSAPITTINDTVYLGGPGSTVEYLNSATFQETTLDQTVGTIGAAGDLYVVSGRIYDAPSTLAVIGKLTLAGGTVSASPIMMYGASNIVGAGSIIGGTIYDSGIILVQGGELSISAPILAGPAGVGQVWINVGATLAANGQEAVPVRFVSSTGELVLSQPMLMTGTITGFTGSDLIDLVNVGTAGLSLSYASGGAGSGTLTVKSGTTAVASLDFLGTYVTQNFIFASDGHGGTQIKDPPVPVTPATLGQNAMSFVAGPSQSTGSQDSTSSATLTLSDLGTPASPSPTGTAGSGGTAEATGAIVATLPDSTPPPLLLSHIFG